MVQRDWKLAKLFYFTYTSIVQSVLQANNPFLQANSSFLQHLVALKSSKFEAENNDTKIDHFGFYLSSTPSTGYIGALQFFIGVY